MDISIKRNRDGASLTVSVAGRIDTATAPEFEENVKPYLDGVTALVIDLTGVNYISSAGLRVLLSLHKIMLKKGKMEVTGVGETVNEVFEVTGFSQILHYKKSS